MAKAIVSNDSGVAVAGTDLSYSSLGFLISFDDDQTPLTTSDGLGDDFQPVLGPDQYWPWWCWLLFPLGVLACCPVAFCIYQNRPSSSGPPSPSGPAGGPRMFGMKGGKGDGVNPLTGDLNLKEFEKNGGGYHLDAEGGSVAATAVSCCSCWWWW